MRLIGFKKLHTLSKLGCLSVRCETMEDASQIGLTVCGSMLTYNPIRLGLL